MPWLRDRTAEEAANLFDGIYQGMVGGGTRTAPAANPQQPAYSQPQPQTYGQPPNVSQPAMPTDEDWLTTPTTAAQRMLDLKSQELMPQFERLYTNNAAMARQMVKGEDPEIFDRYGPEIDQLIGQMDIAQRTPDNIRLAVDMVRGRHYKDLAKREFDNYITTRQDQAGFQPDGTVTQGGASTFAPDGVDFDIEKLAETSPKYANLLKQARITPAVLREFLDKTECGPRGISRKQAFEEWVARAQKGDTIIGSLATGEILE